ncbi:TetR/AcrR family transcriptional regulator [Streptomyces noursei]|uniref:TetR/AcrR family transcriptional regulator n=1 Tax=Streptomyces noursei TaxID=1971 RepID=UPI003828F48F
MPAASIAAIRWSPMSSRLARGSGDGDAELRAALTVSGILGLTIARHFLELDALADISEPQIESVLRPWLTAALGDDTALPPAPDPRPRTQL